MINKSLFNIPSSYPVQILECWTCNNIVYFYIELAFDVSGKSGLITLSTVNSSIRPSKNVYFPVISTNSSYQGQHTGTGVLATSGLFQLPISGSGYQYLFAFGIYRI